MDTSVICGWSLTTDRHTASIWLTEATASKHFARCFVFLGDPLSNKRWALWGAITPLASQCVLEGMASALSLTIPPRRKLVPLCPYARPLPPRRWLSPASIPHAMGPALRCGYDARASHALAKPQRPGWLNLYRTPAQARDPKMPYRSRSQLARACLDCVAEQLPGRPSRLLAEGAYTTKGSARQLPDSARWSGDCR